MEPETYYGVMLEVDGDYYPADMFTAEYVATEEKCDVEDVIEHEGWFARLSMPGYMDCTDWSGPFETEAEALEYLNELYGDE